MSTGGKRQVWLGEGLLNHLYLMLPIQIAHPGKDERKNVFEYLREDVRGVKMCPEP